MGSLAKESEWSVPSPRCFFLISVPTITVRWKVSKHKAKARSILELSTICTADTCPNYSTASLFKKSNKLNYTTSCNTKYQKVVLQNKCNMLAQIKLEKKVDNNQMVLLPVLL